MLKKILTLLFVAQVLSCYAQQPSPGILHIGPVNQVHTSPLDFYIVSGTAPRNQQNIVMHWFLLKPSEFQRFRAYAMVCFKKFIPTKLGDTSNSFFICFAPDDKDCRETGAGKPAEEYFEILLAYANDHNSAGDYQQIIDQLAYVRDTLHTSTAGKHRK